MASLQDDHPDVIFLAEAFTRPKLMARLAEVGFSQSYTYFTWRNTKAELIEYLTEVTAGPTSDYMRPNFWPNTPDILSGPLRYGPPAAFALRYVRAATLSPSYGVYSGYELYENAPASDTNEEYLNSEKYEIKHRDYDHPGTLTPLMTSLNRIRREHQSLQRLRSFQFHDTTNPSVIAFSKVSDDGDDVVLVVVNLDPYWVQEATIDLWQLDLPDGGSYPVEDVLSGEMFEWSGRKPYVRLDPMYRVAHIFDLGGPTGAASGTDGGSTQATA